MVQIKYEFKYKYDSKSNLIMDRWTKYGYSMDLLEDSLSIHRNQANQLC